MNDRVDALQGGSQVLRPRKITDHGAGALHKDAARSTQQHAKPMAAVRQVLQQVSADEAGCAGECDQHAYRAIMIPFFLQSIGCADRCSTWLPAAVASLRHREPRKLSFASVSAGRYALSA